MRGTLKFLKLEKDALPRRNIVQQLRINMVGTPLSFAISQRRLPTLILTKTSMSYVSHRV